jgi:hypothetical protein
MASPTVYPVAAGQLGIQLPPATVKLAPCKRALRLLSTVQPGTAPGKFIGEIGKRNSYNLRFGVLPAVRNMRIMSSGMWRRAD